MKMMEFIIVLFDSHSHEQLMKLVLIYKGLQNKITRTPLTHIYYRNNERWISIYL